jgi:CheY-like chemotaxis protein
MECKVVLLVDDILPVLAWRKLMLESAGYIVLTATSGYEAIEVLRQQPVAVVLLDYKLEGMDAEATAFHVKQRFPAMPIILLSAYADVPERIRWLVDDCVMKSEPFRQLLKSIRRLTERQSGKRVNQAVA